MTFNDFQPTKLKISCLYHAAIPALAECGGLCSVAEQSSSLLFFSLFCLFVLVYFVYDQNQEKFLILLYLDFFCVKKFDVGIILLIFIIYIFFKKMPHSPKGEVFKDF
jgi:hypothetical protein